MTAPEHCVIIGASHAGTQVATGLRRHGYEGRITLVGEESQLPYHRPPLSKAYLKGEKAADGIRLAAPANYEKNRIELKLGVRVTTADSAAKSVGLSSGDTLNYSSLVLATGSVPRRLPLPGAELGGVHYLRSLEDVDRIRAEVAAQGNAVVIGGGYIGLEAAASLRSLGMQVTVLEAMDRVLQRVTSPEVSAFYQDLHTDEGVVIRTGARIAKLSGDHSVSAVELDSGESLPASLVIVGIGILPATSLAEQAGLELDNGICVDEYARSSDPDIYAVGDCASFVHPLYGKRLRLESVQNASDQALTAARHICGQPEPYCTVPWFWSDQYDVKLQIAGLAIDIDQTIVRADPDNPRSLSVLYLKEARLRAIDAMNRPRDFVFGKKLIMEKSVLDTARLADVAVGLNDAVVQTASA
jgi:3-phenylpropionate/trans-cinnamate dioxygenase ferredoxin reductase component